MKWIKVLPLKANTIKLLEENMGGHLHDLGFGYSFLSMSNKKIDSLKLRVFAHQRTLSRELGDNPQEGKLFAIIYLLRV